MSEKYKNNVALTVDVKNVTERSGYRIGEAEMTFTPNGKPAFTVAIDIVAKADDKVALAIVVGKLNVVGRLSQKVREVNGASVYEYSIFPTEVKTAKATDCWRSVTFTLWTTAEAEMKFGNGGNPYTKAKSCKLGMGKDNKPMWFDVVAFTVKEDQSVVEALAEVHAKGTIEVHGKLDAFKAESGKVYFSINLFPAREGESGKKGPEPLVIVVNGEAPSFDAIIEDGAGAPDLSRFGFGGL